MPAPESPDSNRGERRSVQRRSPPSRKPGDAARHRGNPLHRARRAFYSTYPMRSEMRLAASFTCSAMKPMRSSGMESGVPLTPTAATASPR